MTELNNKQFDVIIVGGGMVGSALAALLAGIAGKQGRLRIALLEAGKGPQPYSTEHFDPRVVALTRQSQNLLMDIGAWQNIVRVRACAYTDMHVWDADGTGSIHFNSFDVGEANLGHIVENRVALDAIYRQLAQHDNVTCLFNAQVEQLAGPETQRELILATGEGLSAPLIVAADGARSKLRELAALPLREWSYGQKAIVSTVTTEKPHQFTAWQRFLSTGPLAFLPLQQQPQATGDEYQSSIVWSVTSDEADALMQLDDADFKQALSRAFENRLGAVSHCDPRFCFPLQARHASDYFRTGLVLVGDAAHSIHPLAGQGVNLGFLDARVLAGEIARAVARGIELNDESILRRYQRQRKTHNLLTLSVMEGFKRLFGAEPLPLRWLRNVGLRNVDQMGWLKKRIVKEMLGGEPYTVPMSDEA